MKTFYRRRSGLLFAALFIAGYAGATIPLSYYTSLKGLKKAELKTAVHNLIMKATVLNYGSGSGATWSGFYTTDRLENNSVVDRYSNDIRYFSSAGSAISGMNIEHSFPKSWWGGTTTQAYKDLYNLMPCESSINSSKSNYPMGLVTNATVDNGCTKVGTGTNGYMLWEPADKWKGDFARGYMYMATTYQDYTWSGTQALEILTQGDYPTLQEWAYKLYIQWAKADKADATEIARNEAVNAIQGNRNPFIDFPNLMEYIWGDSTGVAFDPETTVKSTDAQGGGTTPATPVTPSDPTEETIYSATFTSSTGDCTAESVTDPSSGQEVWQKTSQYGWKGTAYYNKTNYAAEASLITPEIDLTGCTDGTLTFSHAADFFSSPSPSEQLAVEVICNGTTTALSGITWPTGSDWTFVSSGNVSLKQFAGKKIKIAFHYKSTADQAGTWEIKSMEVKGQKPATLLLDENGQGYVPTEKSDVQVTLIRAFKTDAWNTLCVPFGVAAADVDALFGAGTKIAKYTGLTLGDDGNVVLNFTTGGDVEANQPCLIKVATAADSYIESNVALTTDAAANVEYSNTNVAGNKVTATMIGTYTKIATLPQNGSAYVIASDRFYLVNSDVLLKPYRAYFNVTTTSASPVKEMSVNVDGQATAVDGINPDAEVTAGNVYNLNGQQARHNTTTLSGLPKGIYVVSGKKIAVW
jgi:endonuclease I